MVKQAIRRFHLAAACISLLAGATPPLQSEPSPGEAKLFVRETALGTLPLMVDPSDLGFSPDNLHYSYLVVRPGGRALCRDGIEGSTYQRIPEIRCSPDGRRVAYWAAKGDEWVVVVDGKEGKPYPRGAKDILAFSPDGQHVAYVAGKNGGELTRVLDGEESRPFSQVHMVRFSPDSRHCAYAAERKGQWVVVLDGTDGATFEDGIRPDSICFSPDSKRLGYIASRGGKNMAVVDGRIGEAYDGIFGPVCFSPDSRHVVYSARKGDRFRLVWDAKERGDYEDTMPDSLPFSPDGKHFVFVAVRNDKWRAVLDDVEGPEFDAISKGSLVFSPNSQRFAYVAKRGNKWRVVVANEREGAEFDGFHKQWVLFTPDSQHLGYLAAREGQWRMVLDGREGKPYERSLSVVSPGFVYSPDSRHVAYIARRGGKVHLVVDGSEVGEFEAASRPFFFDSKTLRVIVTRSNQMLDTKLVRLDVTIGEQHEGRGE